MTTIEFARFSLELQRIVESDLPFSCNYSVLFEFLFPSIIWLCHSCASFVRYVHIKMLSCELNAAFPEIGHSIKMRVLCLYVVCVMQTMLSQCIAVITAITFYYFTPHAP